MSASSQIERALLLIDQRRYADAERELGQALANDPDNAWPHALLAVCLASRDSHAEASEHGRQAIAIEPDSADIRRLVARVELGRNNLDGAEQLFSEAIELDPYESDSFSGRAAVHAQRKHWRKAMEDVDRALELDPDSLEAINLRALTNRGLGRPEAGAGDLAEALRLDPNDAASHANLGWAYLERRQLNQAETHFREALKLNPELEWARVGVLETIKSKFPVYRWVLGYFLWMAKLTGKAQFGIIVGLFLINRFVRSAAEANPDLAPFLMPLVWFYSLFCVATWFLQPLGNATLLLHPFARMALTKWEKIEALVVGGLFSLVLGLVIASYFGSSDTCLGLALLIGIPALPLAMSFKFKHPKPYRIMLGVTGLVVLAKLAFLYQANIASGRFADPGPPFSGLIDLMGGLFLLSPLGVLLLVNVLAAKNWRED
ncbi:MAG: tetratricopeptide repeat protein [Planctomycetota bacterium]